MSEFQLVLSLLAILSGGVALWFISGLVPNQGGCAAVIEKRGLYVGVSTKRWLYFSSLAYEIVGTYPLAPISQTLDIQGKKYRVVYQIIDAKTYHYYGHDAQNAVRLAFTGKDVPTSGQLKDIIRALGCEMIEAKGE